MSRSFSHLTISSGSAATDTITTAAAHGLSVDTRVTFPTLTGGSGLTAGNASYFVLSSGLTTTAFKVSASSGGTPIDFTTDITAGTVGWHNIRTDNVSATAAPLTLSAWVKPTSLSVLSAICGIYDTAGTLDFFEMDVLTTGELRVGARRSTFASSLGGTLSTGVWQHVAGVFASDSSRLAYVNGVAGTENTTSVVPTGLDRTAIGCRSHSGSQEFFNGLIAHVAIWTTALTGTEVAALYGGADPRTIKGSSLVNYVPMTDNASPETDTQQSGFTFTVYGAAFNADNTVSGRNPYVRRNVSQALVRSATR